MTGTLQKKMKKVRKIYGLNKIDMSRVCGFGANTWRRYEKSQATPEGANKKLIEQTFRPPSIKKLLEWVNEDDRRKMGNRWDNAHFKATRLCRNIEFEAAEYKRKLVNKFIDEAE